MSNEFAGEFRRLQAQGWEIGDIIDFLNRVEHQRQEMERARGPVPTLYVNQQPNRRTSP